MKPLLENRAFRLWIVLSIVWVIGAGAWRYPAMNPASPYFLSNAPSAIELVYDCSNPQSQNYRWIYCARLDAKERVDMALVVFSPFALLLIGFGFRWAAGRPRSPSYTQDSDTLVALVTHMAVGNYSSRSPSALQKDLSIDEAEIQAVLDAYKGLFRKSSKDQFYALHLRYARQLREEGGGEKEKIAETLTQDDLTALLSYVSYQANREVNRTTAAWTNLIALIVAIVAFISSLISISFLQ